MPSPKPPRMVEFASEVELKVKEVNEPMSDGPVVNGVEDVIIPPPKPPKMKVEKEDAPKFTLSKLLRRSKKLLAKKFTKDPDADRTAVVQVLMNELPVDMVIDTGCFDSVISHQQWKQLGEPTLGAIRKGDLITFRRHGKYKKKVRLEELGGYFYATVKLEDCLSLLRIYVCKKNKVMPNFLGRRLLFDLRLSTVNAHLVRATHGKPSPSFPHARQICAAPEIAPEVVLVEQWQNSAGAAEQQAEAVKADDSGVEMESEVGDDDASETDMAESATENTVVSTANEDPESDKVAQSITALQLVVDKSKEKNKAKRDKYDKRMAELVPKVVAVQQAEIDQLVGLESADHSSELNVPPRSEHYANCAAVKKAVSQLKTVYKRDRKGADKVLRGATVELTALKKEIARTPLNAKWIQLTDDAECKEKAFEVVADQVAAEFAEKRQTLSDARGVLPKFTPATKVKNFFKTLFGRKQNN